MRLSSRKGFFSAPFQDPVQPVEPAGEEPALRNVETWRCREPQALGYVLEHLPELVVKLVDGDRVTIGILLLDVARELLLAGVPVRLPVVDDADAKPSASDREALDALEERGVEPALNLNLSGDVTWVGGWGINVRSGKAQGSTGASRKLHDLIRGTGEYSIEAWVAPGNVAQEDARIVSYSGGTATRNFMLGQTLYSYDFYNRASNFPMAIQYFEKTLKLARRPVQGLTSCCGWQPSGWQRPARRSGA